MALRVGPRLGLSGHIELPGDKSISHRVLLFAALAKSPSVIYGLLESEDIQATQDALCELGVGVQVLPDALRVTPPQEGRFKAPNTPLWCGNSGTTMRLLSGLLAGQGIQAVLIGDASLSSRPMHRIRIPLEQMGAHIECEGRNGTAPVRIRSGARTGIQYTLPMASAQVKSSIILAGLKFGVQFQEPGQSRDHTERLLTYLGGVIHTDSQGWTHVAPAAPWSGFSLNVPRDMSAAAFWMVAGSIVNHSDIRLEGVGLNPTRSGALDALLRMGASIHVSPQNDVDGWEPVGTIAVRSSRLNGITLEGEEALRCLDEIPVLAVAAAFASGVSEFRDISELRHKESDRIHAVATGLRSLGVLVEEFDDGLRITGGITSSLARIDCAHDHRIAMAFAVAGAAGANVELIGAQSIQTSYPQFFEDLERISV